jgi:anthranilate/para-aminobenzoate synthase component II
MIEADQEFMHGQTSQLNAQQSEIRQLRLNLARQAYASLIMLPHNGPRSTGALQSAMATLVHFIAQEEGREPEDVQNQYEAIAAVAFGVLV